MSEFIKFWFSVCPPGEYLEIRPLRSSFGQKWFTDPVAASEYVSRASQAGDVYIGCLPRVRQSGKAEDVTARRRLLFVDIDCGAENHHQSGYATVDQALAAVAPWAPNAVVHSGNGIHCWWVLEADAQPGEWQDAERRLAQHLRADLSATDPPRILRPPPSLNHKTKPPRPVELLGLGPDKRLSIHKVLALPPVQEKRKPGRKPAAGPGDQPFDRANDVPIQQVVEWLGHKPHSDGARTYSSCPAHGGSNTTQCLVGGDKNVATCFGDCGGRAYTTVDLVMAARKITAYEAVEALAERFGFEGFKKKPRVAVVGDSSDPYAALLVDKQGNPKTTLGNAMLVLDNEPDYAKRFAFNSMTQMIEFDGAEIGDTEVTLLREALERSRFRLTPGKDLMWEAALAVAKDKEYHPVQKYLSGLTWDGTPRICHVARDVLHADDSALSRQIVTSWFVSAVERAKHPGSKVDTSLVLVGAQGYYKSTFFKELGGQWFSDTAIDISNKDAYMQLAGAWIYEWPEIETVVRGRTWGSVKAFMSTAVDHFRPPYGRAPVKLQRGCVIVGTTNEEQFLGDPTGSRRFWTLQIKERVSLQKLKRDQLWAEAVVLHQQGSRWWLEPQEDEAREEQAEAFQDGDTWDDVVAAYAARPGAVLTTAGILGGACGVEPRFQNRPAQVRVSNIMRRLGYAQGYAKDGTRTVRVWKHKT